MEYININEFITIILLQFIILLLVLMYNIYNRLKYIKIFKKYDDIYNKLEVKYNDIENQYYNKQH